MGSPYFVHTITQNVSVVRTERGFLRILDPVLGTMGIFDRSLTYSLESFRAGLLYIDGPAYTALADLLQSYDDAVSASARTVAFLEARYEWHGWEKFQRVIVFDFTKRDSKNGSPSK